MTALRTILKQSLVGIRPSRLWLPTLLLVGLSLFPFSLFSRLDLLAYDFLAQPALQQPAATETAIIAIDERSLQALGPWPWPRQRYVELIEGLDQAGSGPLGVAILLASPDLHGNAGDSALAAALATAKHVAMPVMPTPNANGQGIAALRPLVEFRDKIVEGHVDVEIDPDGFARRVFLHAGVDGQYWPMLPLAVLQRMPTSGTPGAGGRTAPAPMAQPTKDAIWRRDGELLIRNDLVGSIPTLSFVELARHPANLENLRGKAVFLGITAPGINAALSMASSSAGAPVSAVEYHARVFEALRTGAVLTPLGVLPTLLLGLALILLGALFTGRPRRNWLMPVLALSLLPAVFSFVLIHLAGYWFPPVATTLALWLLAVSGLWQEIAKLVESDFLLQRRARVAMDSIADGVIVVDATGRIEQVNKVGARMLSATPKQLEGRTCDDVLGAQSRFADHFNACMASGHSVELSSAIQLPVTPPRTVRVSIGPVVGHGRRRTGAVLVLSDITDLVIAEERLQFQATHDPLTELPNRTLIHDRLDQLVAGLARNDNRAAVLFLDLDRFKRINDGAGHQVGDQVLREIGRRLRQTCREEDTVGRWGGDEFVVLLTGRDSVDQCQVVARKLITEICRTISINDADYHLGASIGIAIAPEDSSESDTLLRLADIAMYQAKKAGGDGYVFASADLNRLSTERLAIESELRHAIARGEFEVYFQPQVAIGNKQIKGLEALIRWNRPGHGLVSPDQFIPIAEESGLIVEIGTWVLHQVARHIRHWLDIGTPMVPVAINVSARQCHDLALVATLRDTLRTHNIPPHMLEIEITETAAVQNITHMTRLLGELSTLGVKLAIDDFGTGYSSLAHLKCLPISVLKIDRSFIHGTPENHEDASISRATIALAHSLGMTVVAEGVENEKQWAFLQNEQCDVAQGFLFSKPIPSSEIPEMLRLPAH